MKRLLIPMFVVMIAFLLFIIKINLSKVEKIRNSSEITISYGFNSYVAIIKNSQEIKQLEDLFNEANFRESNTNIKQPYLSVSFSSKESSSLFYIDKNNTINSKRAN